MMRKGSPEGTRKTMAVSICERDEFSSLEWKAVRVIDNESEGDDCDEVICAGWYEPGGKYVEGADSTGKMMHI